MVGSSKAAPSTAGRNTGKALVALAVAAVPLVLNYLKKRNAAQGTHATTTPATPMADTGASVKSAMSDQTQ